LIFIPRFGIIGAAIATLLSKSINNLMKFGFLYWKYRFQPFNMNMILLFIIGVFSWGISVMVPKVDFFVLDILVRSSIISVVFILAVYIFKISDDVNLFIDKFLRNINLIK